MVCLTSASAASVARRALLQASSKKILSSRSSSLAVPAASSTAQHHLSSWFHESPAASLSPSLGTSTSGRSRFFSTADPDKKGIVLTDHHKKYQGEGVLDEFGLTIFDTLHEMQVRSCQVFSERQLFGTYSEETADFEWMTFQDYADKVDTCRALLKDLGTLQ